MSSIVRLTPRGRADCVAAPASLADLLLGAAKQRPDQGVCHIYAEKVRGGVTESYEELLEAARRVLAGLRARALCPGDKVALLLDDSQEFVHAFWACVLGGFVPCPLAAIRDDVHRWQAQLAHLHQLLDQPLVVTGASLRDELPPVPGVVSASLESLTGNDPAPEVHRACREELALLMLTSGSTGNSKAVRLTHGNLLAALAAKAEAFGLTRDDTTMNWIAFDHIAAIEGHLLPLSLAARQLLVRPAVVAGDPIELLRLIDAHRVTWTFAPNFLLAQITKALARQPGDLPLDLSSLRHLVSGGEAVVVATAATFIRELARHGLSPDVIRPAFGMTETCAGGVVSFGFPGVDESREFASLGTPLEGLEIRCAEGDEAVAEGQEGDFQVRGPMVTAGYLNDPAATDATFTADGWLRTGDRGRIVDGRLTLVGRTKDSIIVNGLNYFSHDLEAVLNGLDDVRSSTAVVFPVRPPGSDTERLAVLLSTDVQEGDEAGLYRLIVAVRNASVVHWGFRPSIVLPVPEAEIPKTSLGKVQRPLLRRRLEAGDLADRQHWVEQLMVRRRGGFIEPAGHTEVAVARIFGAIFDVPANTISANADFFGLGGTSLDLVCLQCDMEEKFGIDDLAMGRILAEPTVTGLARLVDSGGSPTGDGYDPVVALQRTGAGIPLFCVHPAFGDVLAYMYLARYFAYERPFYALRARGFNPGEPFFSSLEEMVARYVRAIRLRQPTGPYAVAGHSYGGTVAFEIAKVLEAEGERVAFVGIISQAPHIKPLIANTTYIDRAAHLAGALGLISKGQEETLPELVRGRSRDEQVEFLMEVASKARLSELGLDTRSLTDWVALSHSLVGLVRDYQPTGSVRSLTVVSETPPEGARRAWSADQIRAWDEFTREPNRYLWIAGEHDELLAPRYVEGCQAVLREELARAIDVGDPDPPLDQIQTTAAAARL